MRVTRQHYPPGHLGGGLPPPFFIGEVRPERDQAGLLKQTVLVASDGRLRSIGVSSWHAYVKSRAKARWLGTMFPTAGTGHFYTTSKNKKTMPEKMLIKKFDPKARKHVDYKEMKLK